MPLVTAQKFHLQVGAKRTTVTLDIIISEYLALHLEAEPGTPGAALVIRRWMQAKVDGIKGEPPQKLSRWLASEALSELVRHDLVIERQIRLYW